MSSSSAAAGQWLDVRSCRTAHVSAADQPSEPDASTCHPVLTGSLATRHNIPVIYPVWARGRCRISPPRFLAECCKRQLNQVSLVLLYFRLSAFSDLYWVCLPVFSCTVLFVSISQVIGCEDRLRNDLYCVGWGVKLYSNQTKLCMRSALLHCMWPHFLHFAWTIFFCISTLRHCLSLVKVLPHWWSWSSPFVQNRSHFWRKSKSRTYSLK